MKLHGRRLVFYSIRSLHSVNFFTFFFCQLHSLSRTLALSLFRTFAQYHSASQTKTRKKKKSTEVTCVDSPKKKKEEKKSTLSKLFKEEEGEKEEKKHGR